MHLSPLCNGLFPASDRGALTGDPPGAPLNRGGGQWSGAEGTGGQAEGDAPKGAGKRVH